MCPAYCFCLGFVVRHISLLGSLYVTKTSGFPGAWIRFRPDTGGGYPNCAYADVINDARASVRDRTNECILVIQKARVAKQTIISTEEMREAKPLPQLKEISEEARRKTISRKDWGEHNRK